MTVLILLRGTFAGMDAMRVKFSYMLLGAAVFFLVSGGLFIVPAQGSEASLPDDILAREINQEVQRMADRVVREETPEVPLELDLIRKLYTYTPFTVSEPDLQRDIVLKKVALLEYELGFKITGYYQHNASEGIFEDESRAADRGGYVGLEWDFLHDGLLQDSRNRSIVRNDARIQDLMLTSFKKEERIPYVYYYIIYCFNNAKIAKLKEHLAFVERYENVSLMLYYLQYASWEDVIRVRQEKAEVETMLAAYLGFNMDLAAQGVKAVDVSRLPVVDVDLARVIQAVKADDTYKKVLALENEKRLAESDPLSDIQLKAFTRYYTTDTFTGDASDRAAVGLYLKVPLPLKGGYRDLAALENRKAEFQLAKQSELRINQVKDAYYEYQYKLKDAITFSYKKELLKERLRKETIRRTLEDKTYSPLQTFHLVNQLYAVDFEYIDIRQQLYLKLLELYRNCREDDLLQSITVAHMKKPEKKYAGVRSAYLWSDMFNELDNEFLLAYLKNHEIEELILSFGEKTDRNKLKAFIAGAGEQGIRVQAMLGDNSLIRADKREKLISRLDELTEYGVKVLHLDIEPHTLPDWGEKKAEYLRDYVATLQFVRSRWPAGRQLAVSIPVFFPPDTLREIFNTADTVYVMAYEAKDPETVKKRLAEELEVGKDKVVVALRPADFRSRFEMERFSASVMDLLGIGRVAFHDVKGLLELDETGIERQEFRQRRWSN